MSAVLREIIASNGRERPADIDFIIFNYINNPSNILCSVATDETAEILGFQSLIHAREGNRFNVPQGWAIIGTHISPRAHRRGVGKALFSKSRIAAEKANIEKIDAYIGADNIAALSYYESMGFKTYRELDNVVQKAYSVCSDSS
ncbi:MULTISPECIES: GNAT family N-acetyltransferase [Paenochrobactrum]